MVEPLNLTPEAPDCGPALTGMPRSGDELKLTPPRARWDGAGVPAWAEAEDDSEGEEEEEGGPAAEDADEREEGSRLSFCAFGCAGACAVVQARRG
jgi:hypothetical protein